MSNVNNIVEDSVKIVNIPLSKNNIADIVIKSIQKNYKIINNVSNTANNVIVNKSQQASVRSKKNSNFTQPQSVKSYESIQQTPPQNMKPMAKKNIKKDSIPISPVINTVSANFSTKPNVPLAKSCQNI